MKTLVQLPEVSDETKKLVNETYQKGEYYITLGLLQEVGREFENNLCEQKIGGREFYQYLYNAAAAMGFENNLPYLIGKTYGYPLVTKGRTFICCIKLMFEPAFGKFFPNPVTAIKNTLQILINHNPNFKTLFKELAKARKEDYETLEQKIDNGPLALKSLPKDVLENFGETYHLLIADHLFFALLDKDLPEELLNYQWPIIDSIVWRTF